MHSYDLQNDSSAAANQKVAQPQVEAAGPDTDSRSTLTDTGARLLGDGSEYDLSDRLHFLNKLLLKHCRSRSVTMTELIAAVAIAVGESKRSVERALRHPDIDSLRVWPAVAQHLDIAIEDWIDPVAATVCSGAERDGIASIDLALVRKMVEQGMQTGTVANALGLARATLSRSLLQGRIPQGKAELKSSLARFLDLDEAHIEAAYAYTEVRAIAKTQEMSDDAQSLRALIIEAAHAVNLKPFAWGEQHCITRATIRKILIKGIPPTQQVIVRRLRAALSLNEASYRTACRLLREEGSIQTEEEHAGPPVERTEFQELLDQYFGQRQWKTNKEAAEAIGISATTLGTLRRTPGFMPRENVRLALMRFFNISAADLHNLIHQRIGGNAQEEELLSLFRKLSPASKRKLIQHIHNL